ncbi:acyl-CoA/acyl-ACP dehydrogenase [Streptomyces sp. PTM05]|uniref:Acyl-CoA/acyl-ACP dehydrogenase n=1 Tax=Streptantibioticus parmotrematis TaxID=2873249 RepID=A0ABS7QRM0_9ACTN|nr:acyl-CoA dehydrogenase family protein [Streptantibioticus parmotrematis]MBY8885319.1 acyl-CoA/acyl-ACP dehydrogenase [Streptantibioticus parmotrematis]
MTELDAPLRELRGMCREAARDLRTRALAVDADPADVERHLDSPTLTLIRVASTPKRFRADGSVDDGGYSGSCLARVIAGVELARGDAGLICANTGPSLAGVAVDALGSEAQQEAFYDAIADGRTWTFFGMTEPDRGSDATAMETRLEAAPDPADGMLLTGAKRYVGNASRGRIGVVFARTGRTALSVRGAVVRIPAAGYEATPLDMIGLRGARICAIDLNGVRVPREDVLGAHLPASRRGLWGIGRTFNVMRTQIASMALGVALAARDLVREERPGWSGHERVSARLDAALALLHDAAVQVDHDPDARRPPSVAKLHITDLAVRTTRWAAHALGPGAMLEHPLLEKWCRDVAAFEFMDGTSNIQRLHITHDVATRATAPRPSAGRVTTPTADRVTAPQGAA